MSRQGRLNKLRRRLLKVSPCCAYCGFPWLSVCNSSLDHVVARIWGGGDEETNFVLACRLCNAIKGCDPVELLACPVVRGGRLRFVFELSEKENDMSSVKIVGFDYECVEDVAARKIARENAVAIHAILERSTAGLLEIGRRLQTVHERVGQKGYQAWLKAEFRFSQAQASILEAAARKFGDVKPIENFLPSAVSQLVRNNVPEKAFREAVQRAEKGERISGKLAQQIVARHCPRNAKPTPDLLIRVRSIIRQRAEELTQEQRLSLADELILLAGMLRGLQEARGKPLAIANEQSPADGRETRALRRRSRQSVPA